MGAFLVRRLLSGAALIVTLTFLTYAVFTTIPVNPACVILGCSYSNVTPPQIHAEEHKLGIDRPVVVQYGHFLWHLVRHGTLGNAWFGGFSINHEIAQTLPVTASVVLGGLVLLFLLSVPLGCIAALRARSALDRGLLGLGLVGLAVHPFVLGIGLRDLFHHFAGLPRTGYCPLHGTLVTGGGGDFSQTVTRCGGPLDWSEHLLVPWLVFALLFLPIYLRMIRVRLLETLGEPWVSTARAKGASETRIVVRHVLRNAAGPLLPMLAADAGTALTAAIYIETIFVLPGLGRDAVNTLSGNTGGYDRQVIVGIVFAVAVSVVLLNIAADVLGAAIDPRTRLRSSKGLIPLPHRLATLPYPKIPRYVLLGISLACVGAVVAISLVRNKDHPANTTTTLTLTGPVRTAAPGLHERHTSPYGPVVTLDVHEVELTRNGWRIVAEIRNDTNRPVEIVPPANFGLGFGLVVLVNGPARSRGLPAITFTPALPTELPPKGRWLGSFAGRGYVAQRARFYIGIGAFAYKNDQSASFLTNASVRAP